MRHFFAITQKAKKHVKKCANSAAFLPQFRSLGAHFVGYLPSFVVVFYHNFNIAQKNLTYPAYLNTKLAHFHFVNFVNNRSLFHPKPLYASRLHQLGDRPSSTTCPPLFRL